MEQLAAFHSDRSADKAVDSSQPTRQLAYCDLSRPAFNFLGMMLPSMGIAPVLKLEEDLGEAEPMVMVNCIGSAPSRLAGRTRRSSQLLIVTDAERAEKYKDYGHTIILPSSYGRLRSSCWEAATETSHPDETAGMSFAEWA